MSMPTYSVQEFIHQLNELFTATGPVTIEAEISELQRHPSGIYLTLKDTEAPTAILHCYIHPRFSRLMPEIADGIQIKATGIPNIYGPKGKFSFLIQSLDIVGEGNLQKAYTQLKQRLQREGLFDRKRPLPRHIQNIGIITSRTGAVIDDFKKNIAHNGLRLNLYDVRVEGSSALPMLIEAIEWFNEYRPQTDVLVVMRGGGSLEDLQAFNSEHLVRVLFASRIPTIAAIGHDRDIPLVSLAADNAVSTPTAAATIINKSWELSAQQLTRLTHELAIACTYLERYYQSAFQSFFDTATTLEQWLQQTLQRIEHHAAYLSANDPMRNLSQGYSIVYDVNGTIITSIDQLTTGHVITIQLADGTTTATVEKIERSE